MNLRMQEKVRDREAIDVADYPREGNYYILGGKADVLELDADYCDTKNVRWIWSIGRRKSDGVILASTGTEFYQNPDFKCLWLR